MREYTPPTVDVYIKIPEDVRTMLRLSAECMAMTVSQYVAARIRKDSEANGIAELVRNWDEDEVLDLTAVEVAREIGATEDLI